MFQQHNTCIQYHDIQPLDFCLELGRRIPNRLRRREVNIKKLDDHTLRCRSSFPNGLDHSLAAIIHREIGDVNLTRAVTSILDGELLSKVALGCAIEVSCGVCGIIGNRNQRCQSAYCSTRDQDHLSRKRRDIPLGIELDTGGTLSAEKAANWVPYECSHGGLMVGLCCVKDGGLVD